MTLSLASYNVLADAYIRAAYYPTTPPEVWPSRTAALARRIAALDVDVIALQEVEPARLHELTPAGYDARFARKGGGKPDGSAILSRLPITGQRTIELEGDHVALVAVIAGVSIVSVHLRWDPPGATERVGLRQLAAIVSDVRAGGAWILAGDFNAQVEDLRGVIGEVLVDAYANEAGAVTCNANRRARRIDLILHTRDLAATPASVPPLADDTTLPSSEEPSDHLPIGARFTPAPG